MLLLLLPFFFRNCVRDFFAAVFMIVDPKLHFLSSLKKG